MDTKLFSFIHEKIAVLINPKSRLKDVYIMGGLLDGIPLPKNETAGIWYNDEELKLPWFNVIEHCYIVAARVFAGAKMLNLDHAILLTVLEAAFLHDYDKRHEILMSKDHQHDGETGRIAAVHSDELGMYALKGMGVDDLVIWLTGPTGGHIHQLESKLEMFRKSKEKILTDLDLAFLLIALVDDYTIGAKFPADGQYVDNASGVPIKKNGIDMRMDSNRAKPGYKAADTEVLEIFNKTDHPVFKGMTSFDAMAYCAHRCEEILVAAIHQRGGESIKPLALPEKIDANFQQLMIEMQ